MNEASKTKRIWGPEVLRLLEGEGIDIGCGPDPVLPGVMAFDKPQGDANKITEHVKRQFDFVFSSHVLEHMHDPRSAIREWFRLVKPGGHLVVLVPDEDLYEQGVWPSIFNRDHKHTFTLSKRASWSPVSINVLDIAASLAGDGGELVSAVLQDDGYDRRLLRHKPGPISRASYFLTQVAERVDPTGVLWKAFRWVVTRLGGVAAQTAFADPRLAQIQFIVRKKKA